MLNLTNITVRYGDLKAVQQLNLQLKSGEIGCLLGPSGCGKTTVLRAVAGFEPISEGEIKIRNRQVAGADIHISAEKRQIAMVFQDFALFPHLTVAENVGFGIQSWPKYQRQERVDSLLALVELHNVAQRYPHQLSGGQQQRVALIRAMAAKPQLLLLDEPFANLDAELREELAKQVRRIIKHENATALMVTHDQMEAFAMADVIGVMHQGALHQWASAYELYHRPSTHFVADFIGNGVFLTGNLGDSGLLHTPLGDFTLSAAHSYSVGQQLQVLVRPDDVLHDDDSPLQGRIVGKAFRGAHILYDLQIDADRDKPSRILCLAPSHHDHKMGESIGIRLDLEHLIVFPHD